MNRAGTCAEVAPESRANKRGHLYVNITQRMLYRVARNNLLTALPGLDGSGEDNITIYDQLDELILCVRRDVTELSIKY